VEISLKAKFSTQTVVLCWHSVLRGIFNYYSHNWSRIRIESPLWIAHYFSLPEKAWEILLQSPTSLPPEPPPSITSLSLSFNQVSHACRFKGEHSHCKPGNH
jgi:hypothetical protein